MRLFAVGSILLLTGCLHFGGSARVVQKTPKGGVLALIGVPEKAMADAQGKMESHCQGPFTVVSEEEAVVGHQAHVNVSEVTGSVSARAEDIRERRIGYLCDVAMDAAPPPPAASPNLPRGRGAIQVSANVAAGEVFLDGESTGQAIPALLIVLPGKHTVEVRGLTQQGRAQIEVFEAMTSSVRVAVREPRKLPVTLETDPAGAEVELDGRALGASPAQIPETTAGVHRVKAQHPDYLPHDELVTISAATPTVQLRLKERPRYQLRIFPLPFHLEISRAITGPHWLGLQLHGGWAISSGFGRFIGSLDVHGVYRFQMPVYESFGAGAFAGAGWSFTAPAPTRWTGSRA